MLDSTDKVYHQHTARILLVTFHKKEALHWRALEFIITEAKLEDYDVRMAYIEFPLQQVLQGKERTKRLLNARCKDLLEVCGNQIEFFHRTVKDFLATKDMYAMLEDRAGTGFDAIASLSKICLALVKTEQHRGTSAHTHLIYDYEDVIEKRNCLSSCDVLNHLRIVVDNPIVAFKSLSWSTGDSTEEIRAFLDLTGTGDFIVYSEPTMTQTLSKVGKSWKDLDAKVITHLWIPAKRILLIHGRRPTEPWETASTGKSTFHVYSLLARFPNCTDVANKCRRDAFVRASQAFFALQMSISR